MATHHQQENISVIDLIKDSSNESISCNNQDKQIIPCIWNKTKSNDGIGLHSSKLSSGKDNSTITPEQSNKNVPIVQENIGNSQ